MRVVLLASGGVDSTVSWWLLRSHGWEVVPLFIDFGQPARVHEWKAVATLATAIQAEPERIEVSAGVYPRHPAYALLPARNLLLLSLAVAHAGARGLRAVAVGSNADDAERGDGSAAFRQLVEHAAQATPPRIRVIAPVASLTKAEVVRCARSLEIPVQATVSCYTEVAGGCGDCRGCFDRRRALADL